MKIFTTLIITLLSVTFVHAKSYELGLNLEKGKTYKHAYETEATIIQNINGQDFKIVMVVSSTMAFLVKEKSDKGYTLDVTYQKIKMSMEMPNGTTNFDSEKEDESDIFSTIMGAMVNRPFEMKMNREGKITEVNNLENVFEDAFNNFPELGEAQVIQLKEQLKKSYGEESIKGNIEMVTYCFPKKEVNIGEEWVTKTKLRGSMKANVTTTYVLLKAEGKYYEIEGNSVIVTDRNETIETNGMSMKFNMTGKTISKIKIDKKTGWIVESDINQSMKGVNILLKNDQIPEDMEIPMEMINESSVSNE